MKMLRITLLAVSLITATAACANSQGSQASNISTMVVSDIVNGSAQVLAAGTKLSVVSVKHGSNFLISTFKDMSSAATVSIKFAAGSLGATSLLSGEVVELVASSTGTLIVLAGQILAIIPNALGQQLLHFSKE